MSTEKEAAAGLPSGKKALQENEKKWGVDLLKAGWTMLPNTIFMRQTALGLDSLDINILLILLSHWWHADNLPFPSKKTMADAIGCDASTIRKRIKGMEAAGFIKRIERRYESDRSNTNQYDFSGLVKEATTLAKEELAVREEQRASKASRIKRKGKPRSTVVEGKA
ncbi:hypothetical protein B0T49_13580 [Chromobacterium violaceum]|nr:helix-turn-helix domain-containing protein [Chromobacterium violaceum]MBP4050881.1 helix-turn-helix domain-containing protein [Chromobacterium violaceum]OQS21170.1 hypothetical protein B0T41_21135 [Chromobacterium violaceum]OQS46714.1 hypothetical protein B0T48_14790 [Chromobacterium violaceum]OQS49360.1 hypothetical protein B0T49_13580 [Chromobacterium violaceum]